MKNAPLALLLIPLLAACTSPAEGGKGMPRGQDPMTNEDALVLYCAGLDELFADPRDEGLRRALSMADDRLLELPAELGESDFPAPILRLLFDVLAAPMSLRVDPIDGGDWSQGPQVKAQLTVHGTDTEMQSIAARFGEALQMGMPLESTPAPDHEGLHQVDTGAGLVYHGVPAENEAEFVLSYGEPDLGALGLGSFDLPVGVEPVFAFKLDMGRLAPTLEALLAMAGPEAELVTRQLEMAGLLGDQPMLITAAVGHGEDRLWFSSRAANYVGYAEKAGTLVTEPLTPEELRMLPADATAAGIYKADFSAILTSLEMMAPEEEFDLPGMVRTMVGIDLEADLFDHLGTTVGYYLSEGSGGGGLASLVMFLSVTGPEKIGETGEFLQGLINDLAANEANGYVEMRGWMHGAQPCHSLTFPGLPVPLELSFALVDGWFLAAATPQALLAGIDHARGDAPGLTSTAALRNASVGSFDDLLSLSFTDTPATLGDGYGVMGLLCSALANGVRSSENPEREPGLVLPPYATLRKGARPSVMVSRLEGDDLVSVGESDASWVANLTGFLGSSFGELALAGIALGVFLPVALTSASSAMAFDEF